MLNCHEKSAIKQDQFNIRNTLSFDFMLKFDLDYSLSRRLASESTIIVMSYFSESYSTQKPMDTAGSVWKQYSATYSCSICMYTHGSAATPYQVLYLVL